MTASWDRQLGPPFGTASWDRRLGLAAHVTCTVRNMTSSVTAENGTHGGNLNFAGTNRQLNGLVGR